MTTRGSIGALWRASAGFRGRIFLEFCCGLAGMLSSLGFVWSTKNLVDIATGTGEGIGAGIALMATLMLIGIVARLLQNRVGQLNLAALKNALRRKYFFLIMNSSWEGREKFHSGDAVNRIEDDVRILSETVCRGVPGALLTALQLVCAFALLCAMQWQLALIVLFIMPVALIVSKVYFKRMRALNRDIRQTDSRVQGHIQENLHHRIVLKSLDNVPSSVESLDRIQSDLFDREKERADFNLFSSLAVRLGFNGGYFAAFVWSIFGIMDGTVTYGMMTAFLQLVMQVQRPVVDLGRQIPVFVTSLTSVERLLEIGNLEQESGEHFLLSDGPVGVRFENVDFSYPDSDEKVLSDFSCDFRPGTITALMGETGIGKSTILRLMMGFLKPDSGRVIVYDGSGEYPASPETRCNFIFVPQGNSLMSGTIRDNLRIGCGDATQQQMEQALRAAAADFVLDLPDGLDTVCSEKGEGFSEGQAQRIAIARALLHTGSVLLLDEPSSALDGATETRLFSGLSRMRDGRTMIMVTHRSGALSIADSSVSLG